MNVTFRKRGSVLLHCFCSIANFKFTFFETHFADDNIVKPMLLQAHPKKWRATGSGGVPQHHSRVLFGWQPAGKRRSDGDAEGYSECPGRRALSENRGREGESYDDSGRRTRRYEGLERNQK